MSIVTAREIDGYKVSVGNIWLGHGDVIDEYPVWIETLEGVEVGQWDVTGKESHVWAWAEGEVYRLQCEAEELQAHAGAQNGVKP